MATYIIIDRQHNVQATRSAKAVMEMVEGVSNHLLAPAEVEKKSKAKTKAAPKMKDVTLDLTVKTRDVLNSGEVIGKIEGLRDPSGKADRHVPYSITLTNGKKVGVNDEGTGRFEYQKDLLAALKAGDLDEEFKNALAEPEEVKEEEPVDEAPKAEEGELVMSELTLQRLRKRLYNDLEVLLFAEGNDDEWTTKIVVHH